MKDEIKEILDKLETVAGKHTIEVSEDGSKIETMSACVIHELRLNNFSAKILLDYITNLQKENKKLSKEIKKNKKEDDEIRNKNSFLVNGFHEIEERIDKAIEYIKAVGVLPKQIDSFVLLNILQGSDKE